MLRHNSKSMKTLLATFILSIGSALIVPFSTAQSPKAAATVAGKWHFVLDTEGGDREVESVLQQDGDQVIGKWGPGDVKGTFTEGKLNLEFPMTSEEAGPGTMKIKGLLAADDSLSGDWAFNEYAGTFKATRVKE
jgi:hypothetical protein